MTEPLISASESEPTPWPRSRLPKASTLLANELREEIIRSRLSVGVNVPNETELIEKTGYSRATVREALRLLEAEGLIVTRRGPRGGVQVSRPDIAQSTRSMAVLLALSDAKLRDLFLFRQHLEPEAARLAATAATPEQIEEMLKATENNPDQVSRVVSFHSLLAEACGNEFYRVVVKIIIEIAAWHTPEEGLDSVDLNAANASHRKIAEHVAAGRGDEAAAVMLRHLRAFEAVVEAKGNLDLPVVRSRNQSEGSFS